MMLSITTDVACELEGEGRIQEGTDDNEYGDKRDC